MKTKTPEQTAEDWSEIVRGAFKAISKASFLAGYEAAEKEADKLMSRHDSQGTDEEKAK